MSGVITVKFYNDEELKGDLIQNVEGRLYVHNGNKTSYGFYPSSVKEIFFHGVKGRNFINRREVSKWKHY